MSLQCEIRIGDKTLWIEAKAEEEVVEAIAGMPATYGPLPGNEDGVSVFAPACVIDYRLPAEQANLRQALARVAARL